MLLLEADAVDLLDQLEAALLLQVARVDLWPHELLEADAELQLFYLKEVAEKLVCFARNEVSLLHEVWRNLLRDGRHVGVQELDDDHAACGYQVVQLAGSEERLLVSNKWVGERSGSS